MLARKNLGSALRPLCAASGGCCDSTCAQNSRAQNMLAQPFPAAPRTPYALVIVHSTHAALKQTLTRRYKTTVPRQAKACVCCRQGSQHENSQPALQNRRLDTAHARSGRRMRGKQQHKTARQKQHAQCVNASSPSASLAPQRLPGAVTAATLTRSQAAALSCCTPRHASHPPPLPKHAPRPGSTRMLPRTRRRSRPPLQGHASCSS